MGLPVPFTPPVPSWTDDDNNHSVPNLVAAESSDDSSTDSSLIGLQPESEREIWADHPNIVPENIPVKPPLLEPLPQPPPAAELEGTPIACQTRSTQPKQATLPPIPESIPETQWSWEAKIDGQLQRRPRVNFANLNKQARILKHNGFNV